MAETGRLGNVSDGTVRVCVTTPSDQQVKIRRFIWALNHQFKLVSKTGPKWVKSDNTDEAHLLSSSWALSIKRSLDQADDCV